MPKTRQCPDCNTPTMMPVSRQVQIYNSVICYKCSKCSADLELTPLASVGILLTVGLLAIGFWGMIIFSGPGQPGTVSLVIFAGACVLLFGITIIPALKHKQYPISNKPGSQSSFKVGSTPNILNRAILWIEQKGFIAGMLAPLVLISVTLGLATLIGYINFTYFE